MGDGKRTRERKGGRRERRDGRRERRDGRRERRDGRRERRDGRRERRDGRRERRDGRNGEGEENGRSRYAQKVNHEQIVPTLNLQKGFSEVKSTACGCPWWVASPFPVPK